MAHDDVFGNIKDVITVNGFVSAHWQPSNEYERILLGDILSIQLSDVASWHLEKCTSTATSPAAARSSDIFFNDELNNYTGLDLFLLRLDHPSVAAACAWRQERNRIATLLRRTFIHGRERSR